MNDYPKLNELEIRIYLGRFGLTKSIALQKVKTLSGGQKTRLVLAIITYKQPHILILDEPSNHLDHASIMALSKALDDYSGAIVVVSHNRSLLKSSFNEFFIVSKNNLKGKKKSMREKNREKKKKRKKEMKSSIPKLPKSKCIRYNHDFNHYLSSLID